MNKREHDAFRDRLAEAAFIHILIECLCLGRNIIPNDNLCNDIDDTIEQN